MPSFSLNETALSVDAPADMPLLRALRDVVGATGVDGGQAVNPDTVAAQIGSGIVFGPSAGLPQEVTLDKGRVVQSHFTDCRVMRINEMPGSRS